MAIEEALPPACAFAISVLQEREIDPEAVPEEAVEAAQQHLTTCIRCLSSPPMIAAPRKKRRSRRTVEPEPTPGKDAVEEPVVQLPMQAEPPRVTVTEEATPRPTKVAVQQKPVAPPPTPAPVAVATPQKGATRAVPPPEPEPEAEVLVQNIPALLEGVDGLISCTECRQLLPEYVDAIENGMKVAELYPEVHTHLLICDTGCLVVLDLLRQEAKAGRKYRRRPVRDPFSAIGWELSGFFRLGQVPMKPMALSYGTLILLLIVASLSAFLAIRWDDARYFKAPTVQHLLPTPDGVGLSDGLHIYDACNAASYQDKRSAALALQQHNLSKATTLLSQGLAAAKSDTSGCNGAEAAIYLEDAQIRQSGHPFGLLVVGFDSGPGDADPIGGTDRHLLYASYTQELVGAYIAQAQYNSTQMKTAGAPLIYVVLANTTGQEQGALQVANTIASLSSTSDLSSFGLLAKGKAPLLGVLGMAPSSLLRVALPVFCHAGIPVISPTATGLFIIDQLANTSMYQHCAPGFAFDRFSSDDAGQSVAAATFAYNTLQARNIAVFYDPSNPSSQGSAQAFLTNFRSFPDTQVVAQETAVSDGLLDKDGKQQADTKVLLDGLNDALQANPRPDTIFAPMLTNDVVTLAQALAKLPAGQRPNLVIGGEFVHPAALQGLTQWARQQQLDLPHIFVAVSAAAREPDTNNPWQKQFYASFCESFATPGSFCSGTAALDQGALLFADGVEMVAQALGPLPAGTPLPTTAQMVQKLSNEDFTGVSGQISVALADNILIVSKVTLPVILSLQGDSSLHIVS